MTKEKELKAQMTEQYEKQKREDKVSSEEEKKHDKEKLEEEMKHWEDAREERMKKFLESRDAHLESQQQKGGAGEQRKRRAQTVAGAAPAAYKPLLPNLKEKEEGEEKVKKERKRIPPSPLTLDRQIPNVALPEAKQLDVNDLFFPGNSDKKINTDLLRDHFLRQGKITFDAAYQILSLAEDTLKKEPNLLELEAPASVVGDTHGQFYDLVNLIRVCGDPENTQYLFLGDYVDRGTFGCEVTLLLLAYKVNYPFSFFMLRGNHESRLLTSHFNFKLECFHKYGPQIYDTIMNVFDCLPVAALVTNRQGTFFCTHGGLSPDIVQLDDIEDFDRFMEPPEGGPLCDLLWSDPIEECTALGLSEEDMEEWYDIDYVPNPTRGCGYIFGYAAVAPFLENNNLVALIRAHEVQKEGYHCHYYWKRDLDFPLSITVFSAPNYCDMYGNQAGFIKFEENDFDFGQVGWVEHPYNLPNQMNAITYSLPYALEGFTKLCAYILEGCMMSEDGEEDEETDLQIREKVKSFGKMSVLLQKLVEKRKEFSAGTVNLSEEVNKFEAALKLDKKAEKRPELLTKAEAPPRRRTRTIS